MELLYSTFRLVLVRMVRFCVELADIVFSANILPRFSICILELSLFSLKVAPSVRTTPFKLKSGNSKMQTGEAWKNVMSLCHKFYD
jgi:hypothetical protein